MSDPGEAGAGLSDEEFAAIAGQLDALVQEFEGLPFPEIRDMVFDMLQAIDAIHRESLGRLVTLLRVSGQEALLEQAAEDRAIHTLLLLYDLTPDSYPLPRVDPGRFIPVNHIDIQPPHPARPRFTVIAPLDEVPPGTMKDYEVEGMNVLVANVAGAVYAVRNHCPDSIVPLHLGAFSPPVIVCPWHNEAFDIRTGKRADGMEGPSLTVLPVRVIDDRIELVMDFLNAPNGSRR
jgi:nitrite reductase (NADH) small subunit